MISEQTRYDTCGGRPLLIDWRINRHLFYTFEIDTEEAEKILVEPLEIIELKPGIALLSVGVLRYEPDHFRPGSPMFDELVGAVHVAPDLSVPMPMSNMSFITFSVLSDSIDFVEQEAHTLFTPTHHVPSLNLGFTDDQLGVDVTDELGPIFSARNSLPDPEYGFKEMWGQHYTNTRGLNHGIWEWDGSLIEHMRPAKDWKLFPHSFWCGLDISRVRRCYRQMLLQPGTVCHERFYSMKPVQG